MTTVSTREDRDRPEKKGNAMTVIIASVCAVIALVVIIFSIIMAIRLKSVYKTSHPFSPPTAITTLHKQSLANAAVFVGY